MYHGYFLCGLLFILCLTNCQKSGEKSDRNWPLLAFAKVDEANPVLQPGKNEFVCPIRKISLRWDEKDVFNPAAVVRDNKVYLIFRAEDTLGKYAGTSRLGLAISDDGLVFKKMTEPVLFPDEDEMKIYEWEGGIEDPRIVERDDSTYILTYTAYDGQTARLCVATSPDLISWTKQGLAFHGKYKDTWSKSGAIIARRNGNRIVAEKINGKYWMYWGDTNLFLAFSEDLLHWQPLEENEKIKPVLAPRQNFFDSRLVESGPYALLTHDGIVLIYNSMNLSKEKGGDPNLSEGTYSMGEALFDKGNPSKLIDRLEENFMMPEKPYEISGQVNQVVFAEGLVPFQGKWFLYYGTADSKIAVAIHNE